VRAGWDSKEIKGSIDAIDVLDDTEDSRRIIPETLGFLRLHLEPRP
jgi:hypothetical protein